MPELAWINGETTSLTNAKVSFLDRGNLFGDGVYEAIRVYFGKPFTLKEHLQRLEGSLKAIQIKLEKTMDEIEEITTALIKKADYEDALVYIQVTRGAGPRNHLFPEEIEPTLAISVFEFYPTNFAMVRKGAKAICLPDDRWAYPYIKTLNLLPNVLAKQKAHEQGASEAILVRSDKTISEGSSSNVFAYKEGVLITPPADGRILKGITRDVVLDLARHDGYETAEKELHLDELRKAEEIFITSTGNEVLPIIELDGKMVGSGVGGPLTMKLCERFQERIRETI